MANSKTDQLANLMQYTVFHIGVYSTLGAAVIAGGAITNIQHWTLKASLICMAVAGACGGVIAASIPHFDDWQSFASTRLGPGRKEIAKYDDWARVEHTAFWIGVVLPAAAYLLGLLK